MATECRLVLSHVVGERSQKSADRLVKRTAQCLKDMPLFVTDGLKFYRIALLKQYGRLQSFARTGKRGRPRLSRLIPDELLKYAQILYFPSSSSIFIINSILLIIFLSPNS